MKSDVEVRILKLDPRAAAPEYQSPQAAGADLRALLDAPLAILPGARAMVPTGIAMELPPGYEAQVRPRSGLAAKHGIAVLNSPGTIDADYRGEIRVVLHNAGQEPFVVADGERIAQLVVAPVSRAAFAEAASLGGTDRGDGGFGSTGR